MPSGSKQLTTDERYLMTTNVILPAMIPENPNYKQQAGNELYWFIAELKGPRAPHIT